MRRDFALIPNIKQKIKTFLKSQSLDLFTTSVENIFADNTRHCFFAPVKNNNNLYFLKIRTHSLDRELQRFKKQYFISNFLKANPDLKTAKYTSRLIKSNFNSKNELDFLLYEYIENKNTGSRSEYGICNLAKNDLKTIIKIVLSFIQFPLNNSLNLPFQNTTFYRQKMAYHKLEKKYEKLIKNINWQIFQNENQYFSHGDFGPHNLMHTNKGLMYSDFDDVSITNPYFDIATLWVYAFKHAAWRKELLKLFSESVKSIINYNEEYLLTNMLVYTLVQIGFLLRHPQSVINKYLKKKHEDIEIITYKLGYPKGLI